MNIFRLSGDLSHLLAIIILLLKIWKTRSCSGMTFFLVKLNLILCYFEIIFILVSIVLLFFSLFKFYSKIIVFNLL
jgi:ER lumen protein retaining receptor